MKSEKKKMRSRFRKSSSSTSFRSALFHGFVIRKIAERLFR